jgi:primosomal protein N' (replication factor Y)
MILHSIAIPGKNSFTSTSTFLYSSWLELKPGDLVACPFGNRKVYGIVLATESKQPKFKIKPITELIEKSFLSELQIKLFQWAREYYRADPGPTINLFCTNNLIKRIIESSDQKWISNQIKIIQGTKNISDEKPLNILNVEQESALDVITTASQRSFVLHGATGSGKTEVYLHAAKKVLQAKRSVLVLVPEIGLTTQNVLRFESLGFPLILLHSKQTPVQRTKNWQLIQNLSRKNMNFIVLGPRSAMFSPILNLGLIVMDEFHDSSYKQDSSPKYNSSLIAAKLVELHNAKLILGSATPNIAELNILIKKKVPVLNLSKRSVQQKEVKLIDSRIKENFSSSKILSTKLTKAIQDSLSSLNQVLIFHNRRGTSRMQLCSNCEWINSCPHCLIPAVFHSDSYSLLCHTCGFKSKPKLICPECSSPTLSLRGFGTKKIVSELEKEFPEARIARFDADNTKKDSTLQENFERLQKGEVDIIVGTQMLAKGLDLPKLNLVALVQADSGLAMPDFRSSERTFQLITQVIGRVGRGHTKGKVIIQSFTPNHIAVKLASREDYSAFYDSELEERRANFTPPFSYQLKMVGRYASVESALKASSALVKQVKTKLKVPLPQIIGPSPSFREKAAGKYQYQIIIKSTNRERLLKIVDDHLPANWTFDIDPLDIL